MLLALGQNLSGMGWVAAGWVLLQLVGYSSSSTASNPWLALHVEPFWTVARFFQPLHQVHPPIPAKRNFRSQETMVRQHHSSDPFQQGMGARLSKAVSVAAAVVSASLSAGCPHWYRELLLLMLHVLCWSCRSCLTCLSLLCAEP